ncbi:hypothetical protein FPOA_06380 [Fusarium poae]|uniref:HNH nuclease domain-containing protein n=1 Tax=Fusarium poae TaxID=36050 RepID=A0A1B8AZB6_FUSPO|nr:hypothetical protein FPOA_06380 [Fusarium poae]
MWYGLPEAHALKLQYDSWTQWEKLMRRQKSRVHKRLTSRDTFKRLFGTSETHMGLLSTGGEWGIMFSKMLDEYCPGHINQDLRWDPILGRWDRVIITQPAQLFPRSEEAFMNAIFTGKGEVDEIYSPKNGLFTHTDIKEALDKGYIAIVPDIDLQPIEPWRRFNLDEFRKVKTWEEKPVKDYKVIVIDKQHKEVMQQSIDSFPKKKDDIRLIDLHNRKLNFRTEFRPRERYIWWMFLNAILHTHWRDKLRAPHVQQELRKYTRYWGRDGKYVKKNQLLGIADELGRDVASLVTDGLGEVDGERISFEAVHALVEAAAVKSVKEINDLLQNGDADDSDDTEYGEMMLFD